MRAKKDWILVKAVCDYADGNKSKKKQERQEIAAKNAAQFVLPVIMLPVINSGGLAGS